MRKFIVVFIAIQIMLTGWCGTRAFAASADTKAGNAKSKSVSSSNSKRPETNAVKQMRSDLKQIEASIEVTRQRIRTSQEIQFLPDLYFMMAELMIDKSRMLFNIKKEINAGVAMEDLDFTAERRVRLEAIETFKMIEDRYPNYSSLDKVLFTIAHEYRELMDIENALKVYKKIIDNMQSSSFYPLALIEVGNIFYDKKDFDFAVEHYQKAIALPVGDHTALAYYKMGYCYIQKGEFAKSLESFRKVFGMNIKDPKNDVREEAMIASVWPFSEITVEELRKYPELLKPLQFYRSVSFDKASYRRVLSRLAKRLVLKKRNQDAADAWLELMRLSDDVSERREAMESFYQLNKEIKKDYYPAWVSAAVVDTLSLMKSDSTLKDQKNGDYLKYEPLLRDIGTATHKSAMLSKRKQDLDDAIQTYKDYLWLYPNSKYGQDMKVNMAEANYHSGNKVEAGLLYFGVAKNSGRTAKQKEYFDSSIQALTEAFKDSEKLTPLQKMKARNGFRELADTFAKAYPRDPAVPTVRFNYARSLYDEQKYTDAVKSLREFIEQYPRHTNTENAAVLLLDCFYVRDNLKGLVAEGQKLARNPRLDSGVRSKIASSVQQAQLRNVRSIAGDFSSKSYADKFVDFAKKNKNSALGEQAMIEAYASLKASQDLRSFQIGEQYLGQFSNSPKVKEVLNSMIQQALLWADYRRAASYMDAYSDKFKTEGNAKDMLKQAAALYEQLGDLDEASDAYANLSMTEKSVQTKFKATRWKNVAAQATQVSGVKGLYYQAVSVYRQGQVNEAIPLLSRLIQESGRDAEEKDMIGHAGVILAELEIPKFMAFGKGEAFSVQLLQAKIQNYQNIDKLLQTVMAQGSGRWTIASLYFSGKLNMYFADFLKSAQAPAAMKAEQFSKVVGPQIAQYSKSASDFFAKCLSAAQENEVFTHFVEGCRDPNARQVTEALDVRPAPKANADGSRYNSIRAELAKSPKNVEALNRLAIMAVQDRDYSFAGTVYQRLREIDAQNIQNLANLGTVELFKNDPESAAGIWNEVLKTDSKNVTAVAGMMALYKQFGFKNKYEKMKLNLAGRKAPAPIHPWMK